MKLSDMKDVNGTSFQSHLEAFKDKCAEFGFLYAMFFVQSGAAIVPDELDLATNVEPLKLGVFLHSLANQLDEVPVAMSQHGKKMKEDA